MKELDQFFAFCNEREEIRRRKDAGAPRHLWTDDPVLQQYRFCNVFREDDRTTRYFRDTVREPMAGHPEVLMTTIAWRWFNRIETCSRLTLREWRELDTDNMRAALRDCSPLVTGAYVIKTPNGMSKLEGILECIGFAKSCFPTQHDVEEHDTLEAMHRRLTQIPYIGRFMAYEIVTDLRHTYLLEDASDINSWASAGPGCCRGGGWVFDGNPESFKYGSRKGQDQMNALMVLLLGWSRTKWDGPQWEMREVEHCLCEYDKYRRAQGGQRLKRRYTSV